MIWADISQKVRIGCNCVRHESYIVFRISYIARKETKRKERGTRSRVERIRWMRSERSERQRDRPASGDSCCAMNKERVGCNGCEAVSTLSEAMEEKES